MSSETNEETVTERETEREFERLLKVYSNRLAADEVIKNMETIKRQAWEHAIGRKLLLKEARRRDIEVSEDEIRTAIAGMTERFGGEKGFGEHLEREGLTLETLGAQLRDARMVEKLVEIVTSGVPDATDDEASAYFHAHRNEFAESADYDQVKGIVRLALANATRNEKLTAYMEKLKEKSEQPVT